MKNFNIKVRLCKNINFKVIANDELAAINMVKDIIENNVILNINNSNNIKYKLQKEELRAKKKENLSIPFIKVNA